MVNIFKIPSHNYTERELSVVKILENNQHLKIKSFLNVGFRNWNDLRNHWWIRICEENDIDWKILEIFKENVDDTIRKGCPANKIMLGDILDVNKYENVDCLLFWHGPEHIDKATFLNMVSKIENKVNKLIIFGMPLGYEPQDIVYGNKHEIHISEWYLDDWKNLGYEIVEVHDRIKYQHMTVFKVLYKNEKY